LDNFYTGFFSDKETISFINNCEDCRKKECVEYMIEIYGQGDNTSLVYQIMLLREQKTDNYDEMSNIYNRILHLAYKSAKTLGSESLTNYYDKGRLYSDVYSTIREIFKDYRSFTDADSLINKIIEDTIWSNHIFTFEKVEFYAVRVVEILEKFYGKYIIVEKTSGDSIFLKLGSQKHVIVVSLNNEFSHATYFRLGEEIYHTLALAYPQSFYHELGHIVDSLFVEDDCIFITGKCFLNETSSILFEYFDGEIVVERKHKNLLQMLMMGFDYYVNSFSFEKVPSVFEIIDKFKSYINLIFPGLTNNIRIPYYLMDHCLLGSTGRCIDYYMDFCLAEKFYKNMFGRNIENVGAHDTFSKTFMNKRFLKKEECSNVLPEC